MIFIVLVQMSFGQQLPVYSQYLYNEFLLNPALAGADGYTSFNITAREQWVGYSGAPRTYSISWQTRFLKRAYEINNTILNRTTFRPKTDGKAGFGGYIFSDRNGLIQRTGFQVSYAYHTWIKSNTQLSFGIAITGYHIIINANDLSFEDPNEPWLNNNLRRGVFIPDADFGIYLLNPKFNIGFSTLQVFGAAAKIGDYAYRHFRMDRHYYLFGAYNIAISSRTGLEPSALIKISEQLKPQVDIGLTYICYQNFRIGLTYRTGGSLIGNIRFKYIPDHSKWTALFIGYSVDFTLNEIQRVTYGTHELTLALKFGDNSRRYRWLDRY